MFYISLNFDLVVGVRLPYTYDLGCSVGLSRHFDSSKSKVGDHRSRHICYILDARPKAKHCSGKTAKHAKDADAPLDAFS